MSNLPRIGGSAASVHAEQLRQFQLWGEQNHEPEIWLAILTEEVGEAAQAALNIRFEHGTRKELRHEMIQVAAVSMSMLDAMDRAEVRDAVARVQKAAGKQVEPCDS